MATPREILAQLEEERFHTVLSASPRSFREELFRRSAVRVKKSSFSVKAAGKGKLRARKLHQKLRRDELRDVPEEAFEEIIRNYLYERRTLLADALDHFGVEHEDGLTDDELEFIESLEPEKVTALRQKLEATHESTDVSLYLAFMNMPPEASADA